MRAPAADRGGWGRGELAALAALAFLLFTTAAWWAVALWPASGSTPAWLQTARAVCFGAHDGGLPSAGGWILLVGEPIGMTLALFVVWREQVVSALRRLASSAGGRSMAAGVTVLLAGGLLSVGVRVASARAPSAPLADVAGLPAAVQRIGRPAPPLRLVDQRGETLTLERFRGRVVVVTFAYAHCETVCPLIVHDALEVQRRLGDAAPALVIVTLDPWRDRPSRLPYIAEAWGLGPDAFVASGAVQEVDAVLDAWGAPRSRDLRTGEISHVPQAFVVDPSGVLLYSGAGSASGLMDLVMRASGEPGSPASAEMQEVLDI